MPRILIVNDKTDHLGALGTQLARGAAEWEIVTAATGSEGIRQAQHQPPDLVLVEVFPEEEESVGVVRQIKSAPATRAVPLAVITPAATKPTNGNRDLFHQVDLWLPWPLDPELLAAQIRTLLRLKQAEDRLRQQQSQREAEARARVKPLLEANEQLRRELAEQQRARAALEAEREQWEAAFQASEDAIFLTDADLIVRRCNRALEQLLGRSSEELIGQSCARIFHGGAAPVSACLAQRAQRSGACERGEWECQTGWYQERVEPVYDAQGRLRGHTHVIRENTQRKWRERWLERERETMEAICRGAGWGDVLERLVQVQEELLPDVVSSVLRLDSERNCLCHAVAPHVPPAYRQAVDAARVGPQNRFAAAAAFRRETVIVEDLATDPRGAPFREVALQQGLRACWVVPIVSARGEAWGAFALYPRRARRPTAPEMKLLERSARMAALAFERDHAQEDLRAREAHLRRAQALARIGSWRQDVTRHRLVWSPETYRLFGIDPKTPLSYQLFLDRVHPEDRRRVDQAWQNVRRGRPVELEYRIVVKGAIRWLRSRAELEYGPDGRLTNVFGVLQDITAFREAQAGRRASEKWFRNIIEHSTNLHYVHTPDHVLTYVSPQSRHFLGCPPEEARVRWTEFLSDHPQNRHGLEVTQRAIDTGTPQPPYELELLTRDGRKLWVEVHESPLVENGRTVAIVGTLLDITERKQLLAERLQLEARLRQQEKLEAIGTLAAGVAHEINNPLSGIMGYADILREEAPAGSQTREFAGEIIRETERVAAVVRNLLTFARQEKPEHLPAAVPEIVESTLSLISTIVEKDHIRFATELDPELPLIYCQFQQIQQVLLNLVTNARDALNAKYPGAHPDKVLRVKAASFQEAGEPWVRITVEDQGSGISANVRERMYEPFFTTKPRSQGTGLGLSISLGIIQEHRGRLRVETEPGRYTRFHVELPTAPPPPVSSEET